jgi:hypothetical protein
MKQWVILRQPHLRSLCAIRFMSDPLARDNVEAAAGKAGFGVARICEEDS